MNAQRGYVYPGNLEYETSRKRERVAPQKKAARKKSQTTVTAQGKRRLMSIVVFIGVLAIALTVITAYGASIKYEINNTLEDIAALETEIENIQVKIKKGSNLNTIEEKAFALGMTKVNPDQYVYIQGDEAQVQDFAQVIKENAYEIW